jgi:hypothetical protein
MSKSAHTKAGYIRTHARLCGFEYWLGELMICGSWLLWVAHTNPDLLSCGSMTILGTPETEMCLSMGALPQNAECSSFLLN